MRVCALESCEVDIDHRPPQAIYCCRDHQIVAYSARRTVERAEAAERRRQRRLMMMKLTGTPPRRPKKYIPKRLGYVKLDTMQIPKRLRTRLTRTATRNHVTSNKLLIQILDEHLDPYEE